MLSASKKKRHRVALGAGLAAVAAMGAVTTYRAVEAGTPEGPSASVYDAARLLQCGPGVPVQTAVVDQSGDAQDSIGAIADRLGKRRSDAGDAGHRVEYQDERRAEVHVLDADEKAVVVALLQRSGAGWQLTGLAECGR